MNWLSPQTIAKKLDMHAKTVQRMINRGELPAVTLPRGRKRVSEEALERFMRNLEKRNGSGKNAADKLKNSGVHVDSPGELPAEPASGMRTSPREFK